MPHARNRNGPVHRVPGGCLRRHDRNRLVWDHRGARHLLIRPAGGLAVDRRGTSTDRDVMLFRRRAFYGWALHGGSETLRSGGGSGGPGPSPSAAPARMAARWDSRRPIEMHCSAEWRSWRARPDERGVASRPPWERRVRPAESPGRQAMARPRPHRRARQRHPGRGGAEGRSGRGEHPDLGARCQQGSPRPPLAVDTHLVAVNRLAFSHGTNWRRTERQRSRSRRDGCAPR